MPLNKQKGNMYGFITHTYNFIKGICRHDCYYCYMRKWWPRMTEPRLDAKSINAVLGQGRNIFIGSSIDMWEQYIPDAWINTVLHICRKFDNHYFFQSKNPGRFKDWVFPEKTTLCTTIETNRLPAKLFLGNCVPPEKRLFDFWEFETDIPKMLTIEPVMDFDLDIFINWMYKINFTQINIGADSGGNNLPEPSPEKLKKFITALKAGGLNVYLKDNLKRIMK